VRASSGQNNERAGVLTLNTKKLRPPPFQFIPTHTQSVACSRKRVRYRGTARVTEDERLWLWRRLWIRRRLRRAQQQRRRESLCVFSGTPTQVNPAGHSVIAREFFALFPFTTPRRKAGYLIHASDMQSSTRCAFQRPVCSSRNLKSTQCWESLVTRLLDFCKSMICCLTIDCQVARF